MIEDSQTVLPSSKSASSHRRRRANPRDVGERRSRRRRKSTAEEETGGTYVYGPPADRPVSSRITISETRRLGRDRESSDSEKRETRSEPVREKRPKEKKIKIVYVIKEESKPTRSKERRIRDERESTTRPKTPVESIRRSRTHAGRRKSTSELPLTSPRRYVILSTHYRGI